MKIGVFVVIGVIAVSTAHAEDKGAAIVKAGPYEIFAGPELHGTEVRKGKQRAPLDAKLYAGDGAADDKTRKVKLQMSGGCVYTPIEVTYTYDQLEARLVNKEGLVLHRAKKHAKAAEKFAAAVKLDPTWELPVYNLASAQNMAGDTKAAIAALSPWLAKTPVATYAAVVADPQLVSLLTQPELVALQVKPAAGTTLAKSNLRYAYQPALGLVAYHMSLAGWLSCMGDAEIRVHDVATGNIVATLALARESDFDGVRCSDNPMEGVRKSDRKKVDERLAKRQVVVDKVLADLGFLESTQLEEAVLDRNADKPKATLPKSKLGIVVGSKGTNVLRGNTSVGSYGGAVTNVVLIPEVKAMVYEYSSQNEDGCPTEHAGVGKVAL